MVVRADSVSDRPWLFNCMEIRRQKGHSSSATSTVILRLWSLLMRISLREFLPMTINMLSANLCAGINPACAVCCGNSPAQTSLLPMTLHKKLFSELTRTFEAFGVKRDFPRGSIESHTTAFVRTRVDAK